MPAITGRLVQFEQPNWAPLLNLVGSELVRFFMWMTEIELADGARVHAYKHCATRRYLHLSESGRTYMYVPRGRYREIDLDEALEEAFFEWEETMPEPDLASLIAYDDVMRRARELVEGEPR